MRFELEAGGRRHSVEARRAARGWHLTVNGRPMIADVATIGDRWSLLLSTREDGPFTTHEVGIDARGSTERVVHVDGRRVSVAFVRTGGSGDAAFRRPASGRPPGAATGDTDGPVSVASPMAGRVIKVLVEKGAAVAARQGLVIVEAMKMENELRAPRDGTVADVRVAEGASIDAGTVLVVLA